jgi:hypothetical protein
MAEVKLTKGYIAIIDDDDLERVSKHKWFSQCLKNGVYGAHD